MNIQEQALEIIDNFSLLERLNQYGEAHLVGNVALNTTVKPDIDIQIYSDKDKRTDISDKIIEEFTQLGLTDYITRGLKQSGKHLTSFDYISEGTKFTIDITQTEPSEDYMHDAYRFLLDYRDKITSEKADTIRKLKSYFREKHMLHNSMSYYIYIAVTDFHAKSVDDIYKYLENNKVNISRFKR